MGIMQRLFSQDIEAHAEKIAADRIAEYERTRVSEAARPHDDDDDYAFRKLTGSGGSRYAIPEGFQERVIRDSNWMAQSDGLAARILARAQSIIIEGGLQYTVDFDKGFPEGYERTIRARLTEFWDGEQADLQNRIAEIVYDVLKDGEAGLTLAASEGAGRVSVGSLAREQVKELRFDAFDGRQIRSVVVLGEDDREVPLRPLALDRDPASASYLHLAGNVLYLRYGATASIRRGAPLMQTIVDDLRVAKKFRILATDRMIARLSLFMDTEVDGSPEDVTQFAQQHGASIPTHGYRFIHGPGVKNSFLSATMDAGDVNATVQSQTTNIVGAMGFPISWFGYGDGSTRATAETQQTPAAMDMMRFKGQVMEAVRAILYYVIDEAIMRRYVASDPAVTPTTKIPVTDENGARVERIMRECVKITVSPIPSAPQQAKTFAVTGAVLDAFAKDDAAAEMSGVRMLAEDKRRALLNWALAADGSDVEIDAFEPVAKDAAPEDANVAAARDAGYPVQS